ncbi:hypothetical protein NVS55_40175 (plasmid) [Myxococcus stipitatus]|uniref:hypothetical protein n=1 Tax=Myxococcus stipitatus TaxID=83455 RepID=UPI003144F825
MSRIKEERPRHLPSSSTKVRPAVVAKDEVVEDVLSRAREERGVRTLSEQAQRTVSELVEVRACTPLRGLVEVRLEIPLRHELSEPSAGVALALVAPRAMKPPGLLGGENAEEKESLEEPAVLLRGELLAASAPELCVVELRVGGRVHGRA